MKRKVFVLTMIIGFIWGAAAFAWQDPCLATNNDYIYNEYALINWEPTESLYGPAPKCEGTVILLGSDGTWILLDYISIKDTLSIAGIPCRLSDKGNLICKIVTQPEISETFVLEKRE